jgi:hypothetical protein
LDPYFHEVLDETGRSLHMTTWCNHNNGNPPPDEGCQWCEKRTPHHILRAAHADALRQLGLKLQLETEDYDGSRYYAASDGDGLEAGMCISSLSSRYAPDFPSLQAPADHPVWALFRNAALERGLDPTPWLEAEVCNATH